MMELMKQILEIKSLSFSSAAGAKSGVGAGGAGSMVRALLPDHCGTGLTTAGRLGRLVLPRLWGAVLVGVGAAEFCRPPTGRSGTRVD